MSEVWCLQWFLSAFCDQSGLHINFQKSELYSSPNMPNHVKNWLASLLGVKLVVQPGVYLGANLGF